MLHIDALKGREMFDNTAKATVQPLSIDFVKIKQELMEADKLYSGLNSVTSADQTDDSMRALVRALYHHSQHYKDALDDSNKMYSTYSEWSSMYRSLKKSPDMHAISTCSDYLDTKQQVKEWQGHIKELTDLLHSLEQDSSIDDSCKQMCNRIVVKVQEATDIVKAVAPSKELSRQLDAYINSQYNEVKLLYGSIHTALRELEVQLGRSASGHHTSIQNLLASVSITRTWKAIRKRAGSTSDDASTHPVDALRDSLSKHITQSQQLLQSLKQDDSVDFKLIELCDSIVSQIKKANAMLIPVTAADQ
eukprot:6235-Heterococcus_DN1.PRE.1